MGTTRRPGTVNVVGNEKGGTGKTTTAVNLGAYLAAEHGQHVLLIDLDPQGGATTCLGARHDDQQTAGLAGVLSGSHSGRTRLLDTVFHTAIPSLDVVPASPRLAEVEIELAGRIGREGVLKEAVAPALRSYRHIIIDTAPTCGLLTLNALVAAQSVLVPVECQYLALRGLRGFLDTLREIQQRLNPGLRLLGVLPTKYVRQYRSNREVLEYLQGERSLHAFPPIPRDVRAEESPSHKKPLLLYARQSRAAEAYRALADEVIRRAA